jgi:hypothetical protein
VTGLRHNETLPERGFREVGDPGLEPGTSSLSGSPGRLSGPVSAAFAEARSASDTQTSLSDAPAEIVVVSPDVPFWYLRSGTPGATEPSTSSRTGCAGTSSVHYLSWTTSALLPPTLVARWLVAGPLDDDCRWALSSSVPLQSALVDGARAELGAVAAGGPWRW